MMYPGMSPYGGMSPFGGFGQQPLGPGNQGMGQGQNCSYSQNQFLCNMSPGCYWNFNQCVFRGAMNQNGIPNQFPNYNPQFNPNQGGNGNCTQYSQQPQQQLCSQAGCTYYAQPCVANNQINNGQGQGSFSQCSNFRDQFSCSQQGGQSNCVWYGYCR